MNDFPSLTKDLVEWWIDSDEYDGPDLSYDKLYTEALVNDIITAATYSDAWKHYDELGLWDKEVQQYADY